MRTTIDVDRDLLERAKEALDVRTYKDAIVRSLEAAIQRAELVRLTDELDGGDIVWGLEEALAYRRLEGGDAA